MIKLLLENGSVMSNLESFYNEYFKYLPNDFDTAYILHANSGEAYCFLAYLAKACIKKDGAQKPLFVATKGYHEDIIELFFPKANYVYYNMYLKEPRLNFLGDFGIINNHKFRQLFSQRHFSIVNSNLGTIHYFDAMLQTLGLERKEVSKPKVRLPKKDLSKVIKIAENINLNLDKFVILAPEALTTEAMPYSFWANLVKELHRKGYDIFLNVMNASDLKCKKYNLSYKELYALTTLSKGVISLKSGLSEFLLPTEVKNIILAKKFHWSPILTGEQCLKAYSTMKLPFIDPEKVFELNTETYGTETSLINHILEILDK